MKTTALERKRKRIYWKYKGRCAYCGIKLTNKWQVDHIHPAFRWRDYKGKSVHEIDNLNPSCIPCNIYKHGLLLEVFREELSLQVKRLILRNPQFRRAIMFGQVEITEKPIVFYFEALENGKNLKEMQN